MFFDKLKGMFGESLTHIDLFMSVRGHKRIVNNVYVPFKDDFSEIDLVMIHPTFIYVVESKNYSGWIFGSENDNYWTQRFKNGSKFKFYNPIKQNNTHIYALSEYLKIPKSCFFSVIVFGDYSVLKKVPDKRDRAIVINERDVPVELSNITRQNKAIFDKTQIDNMYETLKKLRANRETKKKHVDYINNKYKKGDV